MKIRQLRIVTAFFVFEGRHKVDTTIDIERVAFHEAGHALIAVANRIATQLEVTILSDVGPGNILAMTKYDTANTTDQMHSERGREKGRKLIEVAVAGCLAEEIWSREEKCRHAGLDAQFVNRVLKDMEIYDDSSSQQIIDDAMAKVKKKLNEDWDRVARLAGHLRANPGVTYTYDRINGFLTGAI